MSLPTDFSPLSPPASSCCSCHIALSLSLNGGSYQSQELTNYSGFFSAHCCSAPFQGYRLQHFASTPLRDSTICCAVPRPVSGSDRTLPVVTAATAAPQLLIYCGARRDKDPMTRRTCNRTPPRTHRRGRAAEQRVSLRSGR